RGSKGGPMAQYPPPPSADRPTGARPGAVTAAAVLLFVDGGFAILGALLLFALSNIAAVFTILAVVELVIGALAIFAGVQCLALKASGQRIGVILSAVLGVLALISIAKTPFSSIVTLAISARSRIASRPRCPGRRSTADGSKPEPSSWIRTRNPRSRSSTSTWTRPASACLRMLPNASCAIR